MNHVVMKVLILFKGNIYLFRLYQLTNMHRLLLNTGTVYLHVFIPQAMSCGGYNVFDQSVSPSCFSCQRNSSETTQQNFVKLCSC